VSTAISGLPIVPDTALPADIRNGSVDDKKTYAAALGFERELLGQLMQSMTDTAQPQGDDSEPTDAASTMYQQMLPGQLADSLVAGGGTGLADNLYRALREGQS
jgi:Rod binding domain-containing protein